MASVISSSSNRIVTQQQLNTILNAYNKVDIKWLSLHLSNLSGEYHPIPSDASIVIGWWGNVLSTADGTLPTPETLTIQEDAVRSFHNVNIATDDSYDAYISGVTFTFYNGVNQVYTHNYTPDKFIWYAELPQVIDANKIVITITKLSKASRIARIRSVLDSHLFTRVDTLSNVVVESSVCKAISIKTVTEPITLHADDLAHALIKAFWSDTINTQLTDTLSISAKLATTDIIPLIGQEQNDILAKLNSSEQFPLAAIDNLQHFINEFNPGDTTNLSFGDMSSMYNIHTVMTDPNRQTFGRVEILYTDPFLDNDIVLSTSSQNHISNIDQMLDNQKTSTYQWFFLGRSDLSGKYHPAGVSTEVGWIGNIPSAADGTLSTPEVLTITFSARVIAALQMIGDTASNCFPVDFTIQLFGADDVLLHTETIVDNTSLAWSKNITYVTQVTKLVFTITKINKPNTFVHLLETYTYVLENYYNEQIVSMSLLEEYGPDTSNLGDNNSLGTISANELDVSLDNTDNTFTISNTSSRLYGVLKRNRRIRAWLGAKVADRIEWYPLGVFYSTQWGASSDDLSASVTGMDSLYLCGSTPLQNMYVYTNKSLYWLFDLVLSEVLKPEQYHIDESLQSIILPFAWFDEGSVANALLKLTASWLISVYCDRNGVVQVQPIHSTPNVVINMSDDKNIVTRDEKLAYDQMPNHVEVTATTYYAEATSNIVELNNVTVPAGIMELKVPYTATPCTDVVLGTITADEGISVVLKAAYSWGAVLTITANTPGTIASLVLTGKAIKVRNTLTAIAKDDIAIIQDGDNKKSIAPSLLQDFSLATQAANQVLNAYEHAKKDLDVVSLGDIAVTLGDKVQLDDTKFLLYRQQLDWSGGLEATVSLKYLDEGDA